ncbi:MAG: SagB/ThcOx family dehydrogenase [Patescibacteria group bacterium]
MNISKQLEILLKRPFLAYEKFHSLTNINAKQFSVKQLSRSEWPETWKKQYFKGYPRLPQVSLPKPNLSPLSLQTILEKRRSKRTFSAIPMSRQSLSTLLYYSAGINQHNRKINRFYPSAGGRFPLEVYVVSTNTQFSKGLYHYYVPSHSLEKLSLLNDFSYKNYFNQKWIEKANSLILITGVFKRNTIKYQNRGYRYILLEAGHIGQNFYLVSTALGLSCCAIGGFADNNFNNLLDIDGINESVLYVLAIG